MNVFIKSHPCRTYKGLTYRYTCYSWIIALTNLMIFCGPLQDDREVLKEILKMSSFLFPLGFLWRSTRHYKDLFCFFPIDAQGMLTPLANQGKTLEESYDSQSKTLVEDPIHDYLSTDSTKLELYRHFDSQEFKVWYFVIRKNNVMLIMFLFPTFDF